MNGIVPDTYLSSKKPSSADSLSDLLEDDVEISLPGKFLGYSLQLSPDILTRLDF